MLHVEAGYRICSVHVCQCNRFSLSSSAAFLLFKHSFLDKIDDTTFLWRFFCFNVFCLVLPFILCENFGGIFELPLSDTGSFVSSLNASWRDTRNERPLERKRGQHRLFPLLFSTPFLELPRSCIKVDRSLGRLYFWTLLNSFGMRLLVSRLWKQTNPNPAPWKSLCIPVHRQERAALKTTAVIEDDILGFSINSLS